MMRFTVAYTAGTYAGTVTLRATDAEEAVRLVRAWVRGQMFAPQYADRYQVVEEGTSHEEAD